MDEEYYNKHYIKVDDQGRITDAFSDGPHYGESTEGYTCFNPKGGYQLRLIIDGEPTEENPNLYTIEGVPIYKYEGEQIKKRTPEEIQADIDKIPPPPPSQLEALRADVDFVMAMSDLM